MAQELQDLRQTTKTVRDITAMFSEREILVPQYMENEEIKRARYHEMLRRDIRQFVSRSSCKTLEDMITSVREREIDLEMEKKRKPDFVSSVESSG